MISRVYALYYVRKTYNHTFVCVRAYVRMCVYVSQCGCARGGHGSWLARIQGRTALGVRDGRGDRGKARCAGASRSAQGAGGVACRRGLACQSSRV